MALPLFVVQSRGMCFSEKSFRSAVACEAARDYWNALGTKMRSNSLFLARISRLCARSKHCFANKLWEGVNGNAKGSISRGSKWPNKVPVQIGYKQHDVISDGSKEEFDMNFDDVVSLVCKKFPSITMGTSPAVELYDGTSSWSENRGIVAGKWVDPVQPYESWPSLYSDLLDAKPSSFVENCSHTLPSSPEHVVLESDRDMVMVEECSSDLDLKSQNSATLVELFLDKSVSCISGLSKKQCHMLEKCGLYTLRKLLYHFPRTYADLQNTEIIDDGKYIILFGKILSSRGIRPTHSFSFLEVVVKCAIADNKSISEHITEDINDMGKKTIYLHLKKFFSGSRFTNLPFRLQEKYKEGDNVCVTGKVRTMRKKDHYEMNEYNLAVVEDEANASVCATRRPYPIYPSKRGLKPEFLSDSISRALNSLPVNVDPIPRGVIQESELPCLHDAYVGIHQPKNLLEANLARRRLVFDEFFYLQLGRLYKMLEGLGSQTEKDRFLDRYRKPEMNKVFSIIFNHTNHDRPNQNNNR